MDGEGFVFVHPMRPKSQSGEALNVATRGIGVPKTLISNNRGEQIVPQTELQECIRCWNIDGITKKPSVE